MTVTFICDIKSLNIVCLLLLYVCKLNTSELYSLNWKGIVKKKQENKVKHWHVMCYAVEWMYLGSWNAEKNVHHTAGADPGGGCRANPLLPTQKREQELNHTLFNMRMRTLHIATIATCVVCVVCSPWGGVREVLRTLGHPKSSVAAATIFHNIICRSWDSHEKVWSRAANPAGVPLPRAQ